MANLRKLLLTTLNAVADSNPHNHTLEDAHIVREMADNFFRVETTRPGVDGLKDDKIASEYLLLTDAEALDAGYDPKKGAIPTKEANYKVYRTA